MRRSITTAASAIALMAGASLAMATSALADTALRVGGSVEGTLDAHDAILGSDDEGGQYRFEDYTLSLRAGQRLEAVMRSEAFDTYLQVFRAGEEQADAGSLAEDDDGLGDVTNSRLRFVAPANGTYTLRARSLSGIDGGAYSLSLAQRPAAPRVPRPGSLRIGQMLSGSLSETDPELDDDAGHYDAYAFHARAGQRFALTLNSDAFDPVVHVGQMARNDFVESATNDDAPSGGLNSYLIFTAPTSGDYVVRATGISADALGAYTIGLADGPPPLTAQTMSIGDTVEGELTESDGVNDNGVKADAYAFAGTAGQRIDATMTSSDVDAYLELYDASGEIVDQDDDGADGGEGNTDARLFYTLPTDGTYTLQARATGEKLLGSYSLALALATPEPDPTALAFATVVQGEIEATGARDDDGRGYDAYTFSGTQGTRVQIVMRSGDFDTFLQIGRPGAAFEALGSDDDGLGEGTDSRLNYILPETDDYVVRASPLGSEEKGLYSIEMTDKGPQPEPGSILIGATARGTLGENDAIADDGVNFDAYQITVAEGDVLEITLVSNDFDSYLDIGKTGDDGTWTSTISDDDSLSDKHAKVDWTVEEAGTYTIRARSYGQGEAGAYTLAVVRKP
ncbi:hypothetical protein BH10PSE2_BH10PSE2_19340 [soil metagenome]